jgi:arylsulfatase A-like enzyme
MAGTVPFGGVIGRDWRDSEAWWPPPARPPDGAPNVLLIVLDDVGFGQLGCYGSDISTPVIDGLAHSGLRLTNFHTTALCSPTRSCLLTGRNHHTNGMGRVADLAMGYPGYCGEIPEENGFLSEVLAANGYFNAAVGKWHLTPDNETHMGAPRKSWPLGRGFERWYGFHGGETHQFVPALYHDNHSVAPPRSIEEGYHLSADLADQAIRFIGDLRAVDVDQPFFLYYCTGACHSPHHAPAEWIERYRGHFDLGWDAWRERIYARQLELGVIPDGTRLSPRPHWVPAWDDISAEDQRVAARFMECFAAFLSYTDREIGRFLDFLSSTDDLERTLVILVSDNGASAEGGRVGSINDARLVNLDPAGPSELRARIDEIGTPTAHNNYPWGWTMAGNTPFKRWKREVHEGGVADPCIVSWPSRLGESAGGARPQFAHAIDVMPTVLELAGIDVPSEIGYVPQTPIEGTSFAYLLGPDGAGEPERHHTQYFEMLGCRAIYHRGWKAVTFKPIGPMYDDGIDMNAPFDEDQWELYHVASDLSETRDLAREEPGSLAELVDLWWEEAARYKVLPLDNRILYTLLNPKPDHRREREHFVYFPFAAPVPETVAVDVRNRSHLVVADVTLPEGVVPEGVLVALGSVLGGWSLHVVSGRLRYVHNLYGKTRHVVSSEAQLTPGRHDLRFQFEKTATNAGDVTLHCDGEIVGKGKIDAFTPSAFTYTGAGLTCGYEQGPPVGEGYQAPFAFNGTIHSVIASVRGRHVEDPESRFNAIMSEQ